VLAAPWPVTLTGLDVTTQVICSSAYFRAIAKAAPRVGGFVAQLAEFYIDFYRRHAGLPGCQLHDPSALIALTHPSLFTSESVNISVTTQGERRGQVIQGVAQHATGQGASTQRNGNITVLTGVDAALVKDVFMLGLAAADQGASVR
jgi:inosine-uridine nucleoside N-ribohydrolase